MRSASGWVHTPADLAAALTGPVQDVAPRLLGAVLHHGAVAVRLTEVEAYGGADDPGSHAHRGPTPRNAVMFGPAGRLYCYLSYGVHVCANIATGPDGVAGAVLLRAGEIVAGLSHARARRPGVTDVQLARGPGNLCRALGIDLTLDGVDLSAGAGGGDGGVRLALPSEPAVAAQIAAGPRVGLRLAATRPWRFSLRGEPTVSAYRPHPGADLSLGEEVS